MQKGRQSPNRNRGLMTSLGLHSAAIIAFQLSLMQLISIVQWHHFAYMVISIAMLGFGASGTLLSLARDKILAHSRWLIPLSMAFSGLLMMIVFPISRGKIMEFDVFLLFSGGGGWLNLLLNYLLFFMPFFTGSLAIGIIFIQNTQHIGTYYFSNLLGSALGGMLGLGLLSWIFPSKVPLWIGMLSWFSGIILTGSTIRKLGISAGLAGMIMIAMLDPIQPRLSQYKSLEKTLHLPEAKVTLRRPSLYGLVEVVHSPAQRYAPAVSLAYDKEISGGYALFMNGDYYGPILPSDSRGEDHILNYTTQMLPYLMGKKKKVLCINAGTGSTVSHALQNGASQIDAVIENRMVIRMMMDDLLEASGGLFRAAGVNIHATQARNFLARKDIPDYDLIVLPLLESFGGTSGLNALREEYSYTLEAFAEMLRHLKPDGMLAVSTWEDYPPRTSLKIPATLAAAALAAGFERPSDHMAAIRSWGTTTFILKKSTVTGEEAENIRAFCQRMFFDPLLLPNLNREERQQFNFLEDPQYFEHSDLLAEGNTNALKNYGFAIEPSTDDQPYFSQFLRLKSMKHMTEVFGRGQMPFLELGYLSLFVTLIQSTILAIILIVLPLFVLKRTSTGKASTLIYFGCLGMGYMFAEIILIQRFVLYLGEPVFAVSAVISSMMLFSGLGSLSSKKLQRGTRMIRKLGLLVTLLLLVSALALTPLLRLTLSQGMPVKVLISLVVTGTPSYFMGMLFPMGIRHLGKQQEGQVAWAWGINGCLSVISTSLATLIAVEKGFQAVILLAALAYLFAGTAFSFNSSIFPKKSVP